MPFYEYRCSECGYEFGKLLRFSEADLRPACPNCKSTQTSKKLSAVAARGSGEAASGGSSGSSCSPRGGFR